MADTVKPQEGAPSSYTASADIRSAEVEEERIKKCISDANDIKAEATQHFSSGEWAQAMALYTSALGRLPKRRPQAEVDSDSSDEQEQDTAGDGDGDEEPSDPSKPSSSKPDKPVTDEVNASTPKLSDALETECAKTRAILNANIAACHVKLNEHKEAAEYCTEALLDDPTYVKALHRRAISIEKIGSWSALSSAEEDYKTLLNILPADAPLRPQITRSLKSLTPRLEAAKAKETGEMLDKLKGLGNSILGNFGLSTDNFKFEPNGSGGYSMNFTR